MSPKFSVGDTAYVPRARLGLAPETSALVATKVIAQKGRTISVQHPALPGPVEIGSSAAHNSSGVFIVSIGDYETEEHLQDPLTKSVLHYFRLLLDPGSVKRVFVRSVAEIKTLWAKEHALYSHVVLVGHGRANGVKLAVDGWIAPRGLAAAFETKDIGRKNFVSLCCRTGHESFGLPFSLSTVCNTFMGPYHDIHAAAASQFCQTFFTIHFLEGRSVQIAFNQTRNRVPSTSQFRLFRLGGEPGAM